MRKELAVMVAVVALAGACNEADRDTGSVDNERAGVDTIIEAETVRDTTIVTADTSIDVDTIKKTDNIDDTNDAKE